MIKLIVFVGLCFGIYKGYQYLKANPDKMSNGKFWSAIGVGIVILLGLITHKNNKNSPKLMRRYRCHGCGKEVGTPFNPSEQYTERCLTGTRHNWERIE